MSTLFNLRMRNLRKFVKTWESPMAETGTIGTTGIVISSFGQSTSDSRQVLDYCYGPGLRDKVRLMVCIEKSISFCESSLKYLKTCSVTPLLKIAREATWQGRKFLVIEAKESFCPILHPSIFKQAHQGLDLQASHVKQNWLVNRQ